MKVSCVCCTYGRFTVVERSIACWINQTYKNKELLIFNTAETPLTLDKSLKNKNISIVNSNKKYHSLGEVRQQALVCASGDVYICWDDDDLFLPWHIERGIKRMEKLETPAWMPKFSYFSFDGGKKYSKEQNSMEASVLVKMDVIRRFGFSHTSGLEHLPWRERIESDKLLVIEDVEPSYAYVWGDKSALHKTSGHVDDPNAFNSHMKNTTDFGNRPLKALEWLDLKYYFDNIQMCFPDEINLKQIVGE